MDNIKLARLFATVLAVVALALAPTSARATVLGLDTLTNASSGKCMTVGTANINIGTNIVQNACKGFTSQKFQYDTTTPGTSGYFYLRSKLNTNRCVGIWQSSIQNGAYAAVMECGSDATKFELFHSAGQLNKLRNKNSNKCLQVNDRSTAEYAYISQWDCGAHDGDDNSHYFWKFTWVNWS
jgi:hypothetical protein